MDFLNKFADQLRDLFASMTPGARITTGVLLAVVVVSVAYLFRASSSGTDEYLFGGEPLTRSELNAIESAFGEQGLTDYDMQGQRVRVPRAERDEYLAAITNAGAVPKSAEDYLFDVLNNSSPFSSSKVQQQQIKAATERKLSHLIGIYPWVDQVSVMYDIEEMRGPRPAKIASATVTVMPMPGQGLDSRRERNLQKLVAGAFATMKPENVTVTNLGGEDAMADAGADPERYEQPYFREKARFEQEIKSEVMEHLSYIPGVRVEVNAVLDNILTSETFSVRPEGQAAPVYEKSGTDVTTEIVAEGGGQPGVQPNSAVGPEGAQLAQLQNKSEQRKEDSEFSYKTFESRNAQVVAGLTPKEVYTSVEVPRDFVVGVWKRQKMESEGEAPELIDEQELRLVQEQVVTSVQNAVEPLMPRLAAGRDEWNQVQVVVIDEPTPPQAEPPTLASEVMWWTGRHAGTIGMLGLAAFSLLVLRSMVKSPPTGGDGGPAAAAANIKLDDEGDQPETPEDDTPPRPKLKLKKPESLKDDLAEMVREDPDTAAAILKTWISSAG